MGNANCCKRNDEGDVLGNLNFEDSRPIIENSQLHIDVPQTTNQCFNIPLDAVSQNLYKSSLTSSPNDKYFFNATDVQTITQQEPQLTKNDNDVHNDNNTENVYESNNNNNNDDNSNMPFKVNDKISDTIFCLLNDIRTHPSNYINEAKHYSVSYLLTQASERSKPPPPIHKDTSYYNKVKEVLLSYNTSPKTDEDFEAEIKEIEVFQSYKVSIYFKHVPLDKPNESIWKLFQSRNAYENIIINIIDYCVVCAVPIEEDDEMKVVFVMLEVGSK